MTDKSYTTSFVVDNGPKEVFDAINNVPGWWGEVEGSNDKVGDEFTYRFRDIHVSKLKVIELVPNERVAWLVLDNYMNFVTDQTEWVGTTIRFEISGNRDRTTVRFTHEGLVRPYECYEVCSDAWGSLIHTSLPTLIASGKGQPYA